MHLITTIYAPYPLHMTFCVCTCLPACWVHVCECVCGVGMLWCGCGCTFVAGIVWACVRTHQLGTYVCMHAQLFDVRLKIRNAYVLHKPHFATYNMLAVSATARCTNHSMVQEGHPPTGKEVPTLWGCKGGSHMAAHLCQQHKGEGRYDWLLKDHWHSG